MKKVSIMFFILFLGLTIQGFSQTAPKDFFTGPWEITIMGTPDGDSKMKTTLTRVNGNLTGVLADATDSTKPKFKIDRIDEKPDSIVIFFYAEGMDINLDLKKVDNHNLEGTLLGMFESKAKRISL